MLVARSSYLPRQKMLAFIDELHDSDVAKTVYMPGGLSQRQVEELTEQIDLGDALPQVVELASGSATGAVVFWSRSHKYLVMPPFPVVERRVENRLAVAPLRPTLLRDFRIAVVLVRLGAYAVGLCQGESLLASKVGTGNIHSRHRQGGSSANRFKRHREKQIEYFLTRVCGHIDEILRPAGQLDYITYGGARTTILLLQKSCPFLRQFDNRSLPPLLDIPDPRQPVLEQAIHRIWSSRVIEWRDDMTT